MKQDPGARQAAAQPERPSHGRRLKRRRPAVAARRNAEALLKRLEWTVLRRLDGLLQGDYRTLMRGAGLDLADLREYQHHDDVRHIDWNVTARLQQPYVRQFTEDRELSAWFLVDLSAQRRFRLEPLHQARDRARVRRRAGPAADAPRQPRRRPALRHPGRHRAAGARRPPARAQLLQRMAARPAEAPAGATDLRDLLARRASAPIKRRSIVFVVSDFISAPGWETPLGQLALRHEVTAVRLFDALEMDLPDLGLVTMRDAETGEQLVRRHPRRGLSRALQAAAERRETALREALARAGVDTLELATDDDLVDAILRFADLQEAAQPARQLERRGAAVRHRPAAPARRCSVAMPSTAAHDLPLADDAVGAARRCRCSSRSTCACMHAAQEDDLRYANLGLVKRSARQPQRLAPPRAAGADLPGARRAAVRRRRGRPA